MRKGPREARPAVGIHHAPATPLISQGRPGLLEVRLLAPISQLGTAGIGPLHPLPSVVALLRFFGRLLVLLFAVRLMHLLGVLAHFGAPPRRRRAFPARALA